MCLSKTETNLNKWVSSNPVVYSEPSQISMCPFSKIANDEFLHCKKWSFLLKISSLNVSKSAENCGIGHIYWRNP